MQEGHSPSCQDPDLAKEAEATNLDLDIPSLKKKWIQEAAEEAERSRPRPIPISTRNRLPPLFEMKSKRRRTQALKWSLGLFPPCSTKTLKHRLPATTTKNLGIVMTSLRQEKLTKSELLVTEKALGNMEPLKESETSKRIRHTRTK